MWKSLVEFFVGKRPEIPQGALSLAEQRAAQQMHEATNRAAFTKPTRTAEVPFAVSMGAPTPADLVPAQASSRQAKSNSDILRLVQEGRKIEAIKLHREIHGSSLVVAKMAVEGMEQTNSVNEAVSDATSGGTSFAEQAPLIDSLIREGKKIDAIRVLRSTHPQQLSLKDAKDWVEARAAQLR